MTEIPAATPRLVRDLMKVGVPTCPLDTPITVLARYMLDQNIEGVIVLDSRGHGAGMVTVDDLVTAYAWDDHTSTTAEQVMRVEIPQVPPDIPLAAAAQIMRDLGVRVLFMMHHAGGIEYPAAMLTATHLMRHIGMTESDDLSDLGIYAARKSPIELFRERIEAARKSSLERLGGNTSGVQREH